MVAGGEEGSELGILRRGRTQGREGEEDAITGSIWGEMDIR